MSDDSRRPRRLHRAHFRTDVRADYASETELGKQIGFISTYWPVASLREIVDNGLDACEEAGIPPAIIVDVDLEENTLSVIDNGPGIAPELVPHIANYGVRLSSRAGYVSPSRGQQGLGLKACLAVPYVLSGNIGRKADPVRRIPEVKVEAFPSTIQSGTRITIRFPDRASSLFSDNLPVIVSFVQQAALFNPHAAVQLNVNGQHHFDFAPTQPFWPKWTPSDPTPAHWYNPRKLADLAADYVAAEQDGDRAMTIRDFVGGFAGLKRTDRQANVLAHLEDDLRQRSTLADLFKLPESRRMAIINKLHVLMMTNSIRIKPEELGIIGEAHFRSWFETKTAELDTFRYKRVTIGSDIPYLIETAFAYIKDTQRRTLMAGVNWSPSIRSPFAAQLDTVLGEAYCGANEPIYLAVHLATPVPAFTNRAKSALDLAARPTHGAIRATPTCGTNMRADTTREAPRRRPSSSPTSGSMEALASWNSTIHEVKMSKRSFVPTCLRVLRGVGWYSPAGPQQARAKWISSP